MAWKDWHDLFIYLAAVPKEQPKEVAGRRDTYVPFDTGSSLLTALKSYAAARSCLSQHPPYTVAFRWKKSRKIWFYTKSLIMWTKLPLASTLGFQHLKCWNKQTDRFKILYSTQKYIASFFRGKKMWVWFLRVRRALALHVFWSESVFLCYFWKYSVHCLFCPLYFMWHSPLSPSQS